MMEARHGWWCNSKTYPLTCKHCGDEIFYFSCDCGSSVLFAALGPPWPLHRCAASAPKPTLSRLGEDLSGSLIRYLSAENAADLSRLIDNNIEHEYRDAITEAAKHEKNRPKRTTWITKQEPYHNCVTTERGTVTDLIQNANISKKAGVTGTAMGIAMLGKYAEAPLTQLTIHTMALAEAESENFSFTFFVEESVIDQSHICKGCLVEAKLRGIVVSSSHPIWVCEEIADIY